MAKKAKAEKALSFADVKKQNPDLDAASLIARAQLDLDQEIIGIYAKSPASQKELDDFQEKIDKIREAFTEADKEARDKIASMFKDHPQQAKVMSTEVYLQRLRSIGDDKKATRKTMKTLRASSGASPSKRTTWTPQTLLDAVESALDGKTTGHVDSIVIRTAVNAAAIDVCCQRLNIQEGEVQTENGHHCKLDEDGKIVKQPNTRNKYRFVVNKLLNRLKREASGEE
jgi:putative ubiquitin-RnfH superfamily antitoxin RatB of RatAB toxin-antitoxin module